MFVQIDVFGWKLNDTKPELVGKVSSDMKNVKRAISLLWKSLF